MQEGKLSTALSSSMHRIGEKGQTGIKMGTDNGLLRNRGAEESRVPFCKVICAFLKSGRLSRDIS